MVCQRPRLSELFSMLGRTRPKGDRRSSGLEFPKADRQYTGCRRAASDDCSLCLFVEMTGATLPRKARRWGIKPRQRGIFTPIVQSSTLQTAALPSTPLNTDPHAALEEFAPVIVAADLQGRSTDIARGHRSHFGREEPDSTVRAPSAPTKLTFC